jgi:pimeloyl-ACP methyl ester carboxylesterase
MTTTTTRTVPLPGIGPVGIAVSDYGNGQPFLLLHGGGGPDTVTGFGELFAKSHDVRVIVPTHPGFDGTARPEKLTSIRAWRRSTWRCSASSSSRT